MRKFLNPKSYMRAGLHVFNETVINKYDTYTAPDFDRELSHVPIFIIGAPRSGSTLLFQALTDAFQIGYLTNRHCMFFGSPKLAENLFRPLDKKCRSTFSSSHGRTKGWDAPSECGAWWYRFFPRDPVYVDDANINLKDMQRFRGSLAGFIDAMGTSVLFKNLYVSLRLNALSRFIPEAAYIWIVRDEVANAHSILEARYKVFGTYNQWWSVPLPNMNEVRFLDPARSALAQVRGINQTILDAISTEMIPERSILKVSYEDFCRDSRPFQEQFVNFLRSHGQDVSPRFSIPSSFTINNDIRINADLYRELKNAAKYSIL